MRTLRNGPQLCWRVWASKPPNHRKLAVADGRLLWSGGRNLAAEYFVEHGGRLPWVDLSFTVCGPVAGQAQAQFERDWRVSQGDPNDEKYF